MRQCTQCRKELPPTTEFFFKLKTGRYGLHSKCKSCMNENSRQYRLKNIENVTTLVRDYYEHNKEAVLLKRKEWADKNRDRVRALHRVNMHKRRVRLENTGHFTVDEWDKLCKEYFYRCLACDKELPLEADHIIPVSKGGDNTISNIQPLCRSCNSSKGTKSYDYKYWYMVA